MSAETKTAVGQPTIAGVSERIVILALVVATAAIHASRALVDPEISTLFALNAIGYLVLGGLLVAPSAALDPWRGRIRWVLIVYAAITIVLFFLWGAMSGDWPLIGFVDKAVEIALIAVLLRGRG
jgi:hypothetical protein